MSAKSHNCRKISITLIMALRGALECNCLRQRTGCRCPLRRLLCWRERDERNADNNKRRYVTQQMSAFARTLECLHRHNRGMNEARPCGEGDEAPILRRIARCEQ